MDHFIVLEKSDIISIGPGIEYLVGGSSDSKKVEIKKKGDGLGHVRTMKFRGLPLNIELDTGMKAEGTDPDGKKWSVTYKHPYGEIAKTEGRDEDPVDVYVGDNAESDKVFVVHQTHRDGKYDEDKVMLGFDSSKDAVT